MIFNYLPVPLRLGSVLRPMGAKAWRKILFMPSPRYRWLNFSFGVITVKIIKIVFFLFIIIQISSVQRIFAADEEDSVLWDHLQRRSEIWFNEYKSQNGGETPAGDWKEPIDKAFIRIAKASGNKPFNLIYAIIKNNSFNACALPGGQFIIHSEVLSVFDKSAASAMKKDGKTGTIRGVQYYRERLIAPLLAHELAHYYNRHSFYSIKKYWSLTGGNKDEFSIKMTEHSKSTEFDADMTGYMFLKNAGYDTKSMLDLLSFLNDITQEKKKNPDMNISYFSSHPSAHERIARFNRKGDDFHKWAAKMDLTFENIQLGRNLEACITFLENSLKKYPENIHILKAIAAAKYKLWLSTVPVKNQRLRVIIGMPSFRDDMVAKGRTARGSGIPGNISYYNNARKAYEIVMDKAFDPEFNSSYAVLLAYSSDKDDMKKALEISDKSAKNLSTIITLSNLGMAYYLCGEKDKAIIMYKKLASHIDAEYMKQAGNAEKDSAAAGRIEDLKDYISKCQMLDKNYVFNDYTPVLNLAILLDNEGNSAEVKTLSQQYINKYDSKSQWAIYLSDRTGVEIPKKIKTAASHSVSGIKAGDSIKTVLKLWNKPSNIESDSSNEIWFYRQKNVYLLVDGGFVMQVMIISKDAPLINNKFGVGSPMNQIESVLGPAKGISGDFYLYGDGSNIFIRYVLGTADKIILAQ